MKRRRKTKSHKNGRSRNPGAAQSRNECRIREHVPSTNALSVHAHPFSRRGLPSTHTYLEIVRVLLIIILTHMPRSIVVGHPQHRLPQRLCGELLAAELLHQQEDHHQRSRRRIAGICIAKKIAGEKVKRGQDVNREIKNHDTTTKQKQELYVSPMLALRNRKAHRTAS